MIVETALKVLNTVSIDYCDHLWIICGSFDDLKNINNGFVITFIFKNQSLYNQLNLDLVNRRIQIELYSL